MSKRIVIAFCVCLLFFTVTIFRLFSILQGNYLTTAAVRQSTLMLNIGMTRGNIYDCNFSSLTGANKKFVAAVIPCPEAAAALANVLPVWERGQIASSMQSGKPFTIEVPTNKIEAKGIQVFELPQRENSKLAVQTTGYINSDGVGVYGIEKSYNDFLLAYGGTVRLKYQVDAFGRVLEGIAPRVEGSISSLPGGVVLTIDRRIQEAAEKASKSISKGAIVVMDVNNGEIKAMVSCPSFDPNNLTPSLKDPNSPFVNRSASAFAVGSSFKLAVSAAALENGITPSRTYDCKGYVELDDQIFKCNVLQGHGVLNLEEAINKSCNAYFITLAMELGAEPITKIASSMGFGSPTQLAEGLITSKGNLPSVDELTEGQLANFGFGQGKLTATPIQIAQMTASIANGGYSVTPKLVIGETYDGLTVGKHTAEYAKSKIISTETVNLLKKYMISTVESGSGTAARPLLGGAGGKTSSAQTGTYNENGEIVHAWFTGFFPAYAPKYACVVLCEGGTSGARVAAPIFKMVADEINSIS